LIARKGKYVPLEGDIKDITMSEETKKEEQEAATPVKETKDEAPAEATDAPAEETPSKKAPVVEETPAELAYKEKLVDFDRIQAGQTVRLHERIKDVSPKGEVRERVQIFEGIILAMGGSGIARTITLQKNSGGIMVEKIYPINSPVVAKIELVKSAKVRRAKLNYLRDQKRRFKRKLKETHTGLKTGKKKKKK
jgi:large subunit ribosomal protein L19